jgi:hypothetical protein
MLYNLIGLDGEDEDVVVELGNRRVLISGLAVKFACEDQSAKDNQIGDTNIQLKL